MIEEQLDFKWRISLRVELSLFTKFSLFPLIAIQRFPFAGDETEIIGTKYDLKRELGGN